METSEKAAIACNTRRDPTVRSPSAQINDRQPTDLSCPKSYRLYLTWCLRRRSQSSYRARPAEQPPSDRPQLSSRNRGGGYRRALAPRVEVEGRQELNPAIYPGAQPITKVVQQALGRF